MPSDGESYRRTELFFPHRGHRIGLACAYGSLDLPLLSIILLTPSWIWPAAQFF